MGRRAWKNPCATERVRLDSKGAVWAGFGRANLRSGFEGFSGEDGRRVGCVVSSPSGSDKVRIKGVLGKKERASESGAD